MTNAVNDAFTMASVLRDAVAGAVAGNMPRPEVLDVIDWLLMPKGSRDYASKLQPLNGMSTHTFKLMLQSANGPRELEFIDAAKSSTAERGCRSRNGKSPHERLPSSADLRLTSL